MNITFHLKYALIFLSFTLFISLLSAQNSNLSFDHLTVKDGLSQNSVMSIFKDQKGYIWLGTRDGLNRYNGHQVITYRHDPFDNQSLSNNYVRAITEDKNGTLWIGTDNGLNSYDRDTEQFTRYKNDPADDNTISNNTINSLICTQDNEMWIGTNNGIHRIKSSRDSSQNYFHVIHNPKSVSDNQVHIIYEDNDNNIWIGTKSGGVNKYIRNSDQFIRFEDPLLNSTVRSIIHDKNKNLWIGTDQGIRIINRDGNYSQIRHDKNKKNALSNDLIRSMCFDLDSNLWIATYDGLNKYHIKSNRFEIYKNNGNNPQSIGHNSIRSLYYDDSGMLWVGTYYGGLNIVHPQLKPFELHYHNVLNKSSLSYNVVGGIDEDINGNIWVGTEGGGLNYYNYLDNTFTKVSSFFGKSINAKTIKSILLDSAQNLWIGTHLNGLIKINFERQEIMNFTLGEKNPDDPAANSVIALIEDHLGNIWIGTQSHLYVLHKNELSIEEIDLSSKGNLKNISVTTLIQDSKHNIWVGTKSKGLIRYGPDQMNLYQYNSQNSHGISNNNISEVFEDSQGRIWVGTHGSGLIFFDSETGKFFNFMVKDGLVNNIVYSIEEDDHHNLWVSTPGGLSNFTPQTKTFKNYSPNNRLPIEEFIESSSLRHSSGKLYFGGINGLLGFHPDSIQDNLTVPKLLLTSLRLFNKKVSPNDENGLLTRHLSETDQLTFSHDQNIFTIEFAGLNYGQLGKNQYAYMLEGLESKWNYVGEQKSATYTNLNAGKYKFMVKAANEDGIWSEKNASIDIIKLPPFWKTTWAYLAYLVLIISVFLVIRRYFLIKLNLENTLKLEKLEKRQLENLTKLKLRFFTNISHDFRTPLTLIHAPLQELIKQFRNTDAHGHLLLMSKNVNLMLRLINQLMDFRKFESGKLSLQLTKEPVVLFIKEIALSFKEHSRIHDIIYSFETKVPIKDYWFDKDKLEKILYNLLSNAFKNTSKNGTVSIDLNPQKRSDQHFIEICIRNTGNGIKKEHLDSIFDRFYQGSDNDEAKQGSGIGLSLVKNLVNLHKGYIDVESKVNEYTAFKVGIPMDDIYSKEDRVDVEQASYQNEKQTNTSVEQLHENKNYTLLIVEDNHDLRNFLSEYFSKDYNIIKAENGQQALDLIHKSSIDLIISDLMMPLVSGLELCNKIKLDPKTKHIPVILLTARTASSVELDSYDTGADHFISKPFNAEILKYKVKNLLSSKDLINHQARQEVLLNKSEINNTSANEQFLEEMSNYIRDNISDTQLNVNKLSEELGMSRVHLYRKVKTVTSQSPIEFIRNFRLSVAAKLLEQQVYNINEICYKVGIQDASYFRKRFKIKYGISATQYAKEINKVKLN